MDSTIEIIGFDPRKTHLKDIVIGVTLSRLFIQTTGWLEKSRNDWNWVSSTRTAPSSSTSLDGHIIQSERLCK
jgi:hypothetical protein